MSHMDKETPNNWCRETSAYYQSSYFDVSEVDLVQPSMAKAFPALKVRTLVATLGRSPGINGSSQELGKGLVSRSISQIWLDDVTWIYMVLHGKTIL